MVDFGCAQHIQHGEVRALSVLCRDELCSSNAMLDNIVNSRKSWKKIGAVICGASKTLNVDGIANVYTVGSRYLELQGTL